MATQVFWTDSNASTIWQSNEDGSGSSVIVPLTTGAEPRGIALDASRGFVYWAENGTNRIRRAGLDGSAPQDVITSGLGFPADIEIDEGGEKLYWADRDLDIIRRANLDGSGVETIVNVPAPGNNGAPYFLEIDPSGNKLYWSDFDAGVIHRANLDGTSPEIFLSGLDRVRDIGILNDMIYWTDRDTRLIQRQRLDGTNRETLYGPAGLVLPHGLALDPIAGFLYVADADGAQVYRGRLNGGGALEPFPALGLQNPWDVALLVTSLGGDYNGDGAVDAADYVTWRETLGQSGTGLKADGNGDERVDLEDYHLWRRSFGHHNGSASSVHRALPEPALCWVPAVFAGAAFLRHRRRFTNMMSG
jgi:DNA-binding beta-propeller fold protein YncE